MNHPLAELAPRIVVRERTHPAAQDFRAYCRHVHGFELARHQELWVGHFESPEPRLAIVAPPACGKSRVNRMWLEYTIGRNPEECWLLLMKSADQAETQVMDVEATIKTNQRYRQVFPAVQPDPEKSWRHDKMWVQRRNGRADATLFGCGITGPYQGVHVEGILLDDPTNQKDVFSETAMAEQVSYVKGVMLDRLVGRKVFRVIFTRWGSNDLYGTLADLGFTIVDMPIMGDYSWGPLLWPEQFPLSAVESLREDKGDLFDLTYMGDASLGQEASAITGFLFYDKLPERGLLVQSWDTAGTTSHTAAYSCGGTWLKDRQDFYLKDLVRRRWEYPDLRSQVALLWQKHRPRVVLVEEKSTGQSIVQDLRRPEVGRPAIPVQGVKLGGKQGLEPDKLMRARLAARHVKEGHVWLPRQAPWLAAFLAECAQFPRGRYRDQIDQMSQAILWLNKAQPSWDMTVIQGTAAPVLASRGDPLHDKRMQVLRAGRTGAVLSLEQRAG